MQKIYNISSMLQGNFVILEVLCKAKFDFRKEKKSIFLSNNIVAQKNCGSRKKQCKIIVFFNNSLKTYQQIHTVKVHK